MERFTNIRKNVDLIRQVLDQEDGSTREKEKLESSSKEKILEITDQILKEL